MPTPAPSKTIPPGRLPMLPSSTEALWALATMPYAEEGQDGFRIKSLASRENGLVLSQAPFCCARPQAAFAAAHGLIRKLPHTHRYVVMFIEITAPLVLQAAQGRHKSGGRWIFARVGEDYW